MGTEKPHPKSVEALLGALRAHGFRVTPQRIAICAVLAGMEIHPTAYDVYDAVRRERSDISLATVYTALKALTRAGAILDLHTAANNSTHYELDTRPHVNFFCTRTGRVDNIAAASVGALKQAIELDGRTVSDMRILVYGTTDEADRRPTRHS